MTEHSADLCGKILIAMPDMGDPRFDQSVVYMCAHSDEGSMGLIVNKPQPKLRFSNLLKQLEIPASDAARDIRVHFGGPVETTRGFVLHSTDYHSDKGTMEVSGDVGMTATLDVLEDIAKGDGPATSMLALGYTGWGPGQLEAEIGDNGWLTCDPSESILFGKENDDKWQAALALLGIDPLLLSSTAGRA